MQHQQHPAQLHPPGSVGSLVTCGLSKKSAVDVPNTRPGLSVLVNDCRHNVYMQLLTGAATCSSVGLDVSKKHKLSGDVTNLEAFFSFHQTSTFFGHKLLI